MIMIYTNVTERIYAVSVWWNYLLDNDYIQKADLEKEVEE